MNSIERVKAALHFTGPDKVPIFKIGLSSDVFPTVMLPSKNWHPGHRESEKGLFPHGADDLIYKFHIRRWKKPDWAKKNPKFRGTKWLKVKREEIDEWGCIWNRDGTNKTMGHPGRPSLLNYEDLDKYLSIYTPDPFDKSRYSLLIKASKILGRKRYRLFSAGYFGPSQTAAAIRGFNQYLIDHRRNSEHLKKLLKHLTEFTINTMDAWIKFGGKPHGFLIVDDLGEQKGPFFGPKTFEKFYEPVYGEIIKAAHDRGCEMHMHSCGNLAPLIPIFIKWGLDAFEFDSPRMTGYDQLKPFRGKIMFWACVNIQSIYTQGTPKECEREVWHMMRNLGTKNGGFGAYFYPQTYHIKAPKENIKAFKRGLKKYGKYSKIPEHWWNYPTLEKWDYYTVPELPPLTASPNP
ncbi:MAG: uroporphyrinogen decarboxylase family protein [Promethearchaeota archaeon]